MWKRLMRAHQRRMRRFMTRQYGRMPNPPILVNCKWYLWEVRE